MRTRNSGSVIRAARGLIFTAGLALACTDSPTGTAATYTVGGTVSGLAGSGLVLRDNGGDDLAVSADGAFAFVTELAGGDSYTVTVFARPSRPAQHCTVTAGSGTMASANVTTVAIVCATDSYTVGGMVSGLTGAGLVLRDNGGDDLAVSADGPFVFATQLASGGSYSVTVLTQPTSPAQRCAVTNGSGTVATANVTNVAIACVTNTGMGTVRVTASTTGANVPATYTVDADPGTSGSSTADVLANGTVSFDLAPGAHTVSLTVTRNCTVTSPNNVPVTVAAGATTDIAFSVTCEPPPTGTIQVTVTTTGTDAPATYQVRATGVYDTPGSFSASIPSNGAASLAVGGGLYLVKLVVPPNCTVTSPNNVAGTNVAFTVTCVSAGTLNVIVATTGPNAPTTYTLGVYPYWGTSLYSAPMATNGTATLILPPGSQTALLVVPPNCTVTSPNNVSVNVHGGTTSNLVFTAACQ